jgi:hypothetical protein
LGDVASAYRRAGGLAVVVAAAAIGLAACAGSGSPHVASLGKSSGSSPAGGTSTSAPSTGNPTELLDEWAACMRKHGDPGQADPTITASKVIDIPVGAGGADGLKSLLASAGGRSCASRLTAAQRELAGISDSGERPAQATLVKFAECMRVNGAPNWPDPGPNGTGFSEIGVGLNSPGVQNAVKACAKRLGVQAFSGGMAGAPGSIMPSIGGSGAGS